jgi:hypothetical protein
MTNPSQKIATSIAWGLAFSSGAEMMLGAIVGARGGAQLGQGKDVAEVTESLTQSFYRWKTIVPVVAGVIGLALGLAGRLPGTQDR